MASKSRVMRSIGKMEIYEDEAKTFSKHTLVEGTGDESPNEGSVCVVGITNVDNVDLSEVELGGYEMGDRVEVTIGEGDCFLSELFDRVIKSMKAGEQAYVKAKTDIRGTKVEESLMREKAFKFNMFLWSFQRAADLKDLEGDERLERAQHHKNKGTELFKANNISFAIKRYEKALVYLGGRGESKKLPGELPLQHKTLIVQCHLNLAASRLKTEDYERVIKHCTEALEVDAKSVKGLFRRAQAYFKQSKYNEAREDFSSVLDVEPQNKAALKEVAVIDSMFKKEKAMCQKMFG